MGKSKAVLRELYCSVVAKRELLKTAELSVFTSALVPILTYGHKSWVMTERILSKCKRQTLNFCEVFIA